MNRNIAPTPYHHGDLPAALRRVAWDIVAESGARGVSLRECARRAGVSHAAPAHHFGSLQGLLAEVAADGYERMVEYIDAAMEEAGDRVGACGIGYVRFAIAHPQHFRLMLGTDLRGYALPRLRQASGAAYERLRGSLREAWTQKHGVAPGPSLLEARTMLAWSTAHGYASLAIDHTPLSAALPELEVISAPLLPALLAP